MQKPNFPNEVFAVSARPGAPKDGNPVIKIVKIPAKYSTKSASTMNGRRIALEKMGKFSVFAESAAYTVVTGHAQNIEQAQSMGKEMIAWLKDHAEKRLASYTRMVASLNAEPVVIEEDYRD